MEGISRRSFLKGVGVVGATAAMGAGLAACSPAAEPSTGGSDAVETASGIGVVVDAASTEEADIVVVGSGIGGFMASMIAKEQAPDATVVMLEKNAKLWAGQHELRGVQRAGIPTSPEAEARLKGLRRRRARTGYIANSMLHAERLREQGDNADWLFALHGVGYWNPGRPRCSTKAATDLRASPRSLPSPRKRASISAPRRGPRHCSPTTSTPSRACSTTERRGRRRAHRGESRHSGHRWHEHEQKPARPILQSGHGQDHRLGRGPGRRWAPLGRADRAWACEPSYGGFAIQQCRQRHRLSRLRLASWAYRPPCSTATAS